MQEFCAHIERTNILRTLRYGFDIRGCKFRAVYWRPETSTDAAALERYEQNILTCVRQLRYGAQSQKPLDAVFFVNGLPLVTVTPKDSPTGQSLDDAIAQYVCDCKPSEKIFQFGRRTLIHFAADNFCAAVTTKLEGTDTKFLPFNPDSKSSTSACPLREILCKDTLLELLQKYLLVDDERIIFPCRHQLDVVTKLLAHVHSHGAGKSNSMAWLAQRLTNLRDVADEKIFDSVLVVTDRRVLEQKLQDTVAHIEQVPGLVVKVNTPAEFRNALNDGKKIIIMTLKKFLATYREVVSANKKFAIIVDEAHLSQTDTASKLKPSPTDKVLADEDFLDANERAYIDRLKCHFDTYARITAEHDIATAEVREAAKPLAELAFDMISLIEESSKFIEQLNLPMDEIEAVLAEYVLDNPDVSEDDEIPFSPEFILNFTPEKLEALFNEYMSRKNSTEVKADDSFDELKAKFDAQIHYITALARAAHDEVNFSDAQDELLAELDAHGRQENLSFFAFSAALKPQVSKFFGTQNESGGCEPFHVCSMRRAIDDGFILDVLKNYVTQSLDVDEQKISASRHPHAIAAKTAIIMTEFVNKTRNKIGGHAKAMVVTSSRLHAVKYFFAIKRYIASTKLSSVNVAVAFSDLVEDGDNIYSERSLNGFNEKQLVENFHGYEFNILIVAGKYLADFDEPLLHSMFVDKKLDGVKAVQTFSRLNRTCASKVDTFILDFVNDADTIRKAFLPFYQI